MTFGYFRTMAGKSRQKLLNCSIVSLSATGYAFAALRANRSVVAWGDNLRGGEIPPEIAALKDVASLKAATYAFAVLRADRSVVSWGDNGGGGISVPPGIARLQDIVSLSASGSSFSVLRANGERLAWDVGGDNIVHSEYDD